jgi:hypothetical protein
MNVNQEGTEGGGGVEVQLHSFFNLGSRQGWVVWRFKISILFPTLTQYSTSACQFGVRPLSILPLIQMSLKECWLWQL